MTEQEPNTFFEVFNQKAAVLAAFGALGGSVRAAVLKSTWRESLRVIFVGGAVSFGVGVIGPSLMPPVFNFSTATSMGALTASAFLLGLIAVTVVERIFTNIWGGKER